MFCLNYFLKISKKLLIFLVFNLYIYLILFIIFIVVILLSLKNIHPLMIGIFLILQVFCVVLLLGFFFCSRFYSIILYLIIVGGILILFLYFNRFALNNKVILIKVGVLNFLFKIFFLILIIFYLIYSYDERRIILFLNDTIFEIKGKILNYDFRLTYVYLKFRILIFFIILYLLFVLILVVKILLFYKTKRMRQIL